MWYTIWFPYLLDNLSAPVDYRHCDNKEARRAEYIEAINNIWGKKPSFCEHIDMESLKNIQNKSYQRDEQVDKIIEMCSGET